MYRDECESECKVKLGKHINAINIHRKIHVMVFIMTIIEVHPHYIAWHVGNGNENIKLITKMGAKARVNKGKAREVDKISLYNNYKKN